MNPRRGDIVLVEFLDHVEDGDEPMRCFVAGRLRYKGKVQSLGGRPRRYMILESWWLTDEADEDVQRENAKTFTILTSTVERVTLLQTDRKEPPPHRCKGQCGKPAGGSQGSSEESRSGSKCSQDRSETYPVPNRGCGQRRSKSD